MSARRAAALAFLAAALVRSAWLLGQGPEPRRAMSADSHGYARLALNMRERAVFSLDEEPPFSPDTLRTPGYPAFLSLFRGPRPALWWQAALGAASCALVALTASALGAAPRAALAAGLLLSADLVSAAHAGQLLTDVLFQFLVALALWKLACGRPGPAGVAVGVAALVRPIGLYFPVPAAAIAALGAPPGRRLRWAALALAGGLLLPLCWIARNKARTGVATFSSLQGLNALLRAAVVASEVTGKPYAQAYGELDRRMREEYGPFRSVIEESEAASRTAAAYIASRPIGYLRVCAKDLFRLLGGHGLDVAAWTLLKDPRYDPMSPEVVSGGFSGTRQLLERHPGLRWALAAYWLFLLGLYGLAARGLWVLARERRWEAAALGGAPVLYFLALTLGMGAYYRLRLPLLPPLCLLAAFGLPPSKRP